MACLFLRTTLDTQKQNKKDAEEILWCSRHVSRLLRAGGSAQLQGTEEVQASGFVGTEARKDASKVAPFIIMLGWKSPRLYHQAQKYTRKMVRVLQLTWSVHDHGCHHEVGHRGVAVRWQERDRVRVHLSNPDASTDMICPSSLEQDGLPGIYRENRTRVTGIESGHRLVNDVNGNHFFAFFLGSVLSIGSPRDEWIDAPNFSLVSVCSPANFSPRRSKNLPEIYVALW